MRDPADFAVAEKFKYDLTALWASLAPYAQEIEGVTVSNTSLLETTDALRKLLEASYGQRLTFKGEHRRASGPYVVGRAEIDDIAGEVAAVRARSIRSGQVSGTVVAKAGHDGGRAVGVEIDDIG
ncbi:hypothetical protein [Amycolatopsis sp. NPDC004169]|uniref:hypothetical protein n=1 Tax=Amycolatopsis sp. NPDC004169 TaxID=3154453 RepID=UPI0033B7970A